jgi:hypothetical protein
MLGRKRDGLRLGGRRMEEEAAWYLLPSGFLNLSYEHWWLE